MQNDGKDFPRFRTTYLYKRANDAKVFGQ